jgi:hypothetical protein
MRKSQPHREPLAAGGQAEQTPTAPQAFKFSPADLAALEAALRGNAHRGALVRSLQETVEAGLESLRRSQPPAITQAGRGARKQERANLDALVKNLRATLRTWRALSESSRLQIAWNFESLLKLPVDAFADSLDLVIELVYPFMIEAHSGAGTPPDETGRTFGGLAVLDCLRIGGIPMSASAKRSARTGPPAPSPLLICIGTVLRALGSDRQPETVIDEARIHYEGLPIENLPGGGCARVAKGVLVPILPTEVKHWTSLWQGRVLQEMRAKRR